MFYCIVYFENSNILDIIVIFHFQIVDYLYRIISTYLSESCTFQYRIGALYALYSVYQTQPCEPKLKVCTCTYYNRHKFAQLRGHMVSASDIIKIFFEFALQQSVTIVYM